jgi:hypothetical protein
MRLKPLDRQYLAAYNTPELALLHLMITGEVVSVDAGPSHWNRPHMIAIGSEHQRSAATSEDHMMSRQERDMLALACPFGFSL